MTPKFLGWPFTNFGCFGATTQINKCYIQVTLALPESGGYNIKVWPAE